MFSVSHVVDALFLKNYRPVEGPEVSGARIRGASRAREYISQSRVLSPITPTVLAGCARRGAPIGATRDRQHQEIKAGGARRADTRGETLWSRAISVSAGGRLEASYNKRVDLRADQVAQHPASYNMLASGARRPVMAGNATFEGAAGEPCPARAA